MKMKYLLFLLLLPLLCFSKYYEGSIKFTDGKVLKGFMEVPEINDSKINYKPDLKGKSEKFSIDLIDQIDFVSDSNETVTFYATKYYKSTGLGKVKGLSEDKIWLQLIYDGKLKIYNGSNTILSYGIGGKYMNKSSTTISYYFKAPNREYPQKVFEDYPNMGTIGVFKMQKRQIEAYFKDDCPNLVNLLIKEEIKTKGYTLIGELFDQNCGK